MVKRVTGLMSQDTGVGYYRIGQPTLFIGRASSKKCRITPFTGTNQPVTVGQTVYKKPAWNDKMLMEISKGTDVLFSNMLYDRDEILKMINLRKWSGAKWVVDIDDNVYAVPNDNPGSSGAKAAQAGMELCAYAADGVTVSVPNLVQLYKPLNPNIYVNPNGIDFDWWGQFTNRKHRGLRIGWRGAYGHKTDVMLIKPVIEELKKKYNFEFVAFGVKPPFDCEWHDWVPFLKYPKKLASLGLDIAVVPLADTSYNRCKSNLAILEFSSLKIPVVASPTENQKGLPISYASTPYEWYDALERLLKSRTIRIKQGKAQYDHVKHNFDMTVLTPPFRKWLTDLPRKSL